MSEPTTIDEIRRELSAHPLVSYERGEKLRAQLELLASGIYTPRHTPEEVTRFMAQHGDGLSLYRNHPQASNFPYVWCLFTIKSQHVYGDTVEECFDKAIEA